MIVKRDYFVFVSSLTQFNHWQKFVVFDAISKYTICNLIHVKNKRFFDVRVVSFWKNHAILWIRHDFCSAFCQFIVCQIFVRMYSNLNILLLQRQVLYVVENNSIVA
jgi:fructose-1,6-bisphosphatase